MDKINIYGPTDILVLSINVDDTSYRYKAIMAENSLNLKFSLPEYIQIEVDSYVDYKAERYFLFEEQTFVKNNTRNFEYNLTLLTHEALLRTKQFKFFLSDELGNTIPPLKVKGSFTGKPLDFLNLIVRNMNDGDTGWVVGSYIEGEQKTLSFNQITCAEFLKQVCNEYKTEYDVVLKTINMGKVEKDKANPLSLSYGKGNGLKSGVKRNNGEASKINRIYVQGGSTNIDKSKYRISNMVGSDILKIPANASKVYNGVTYVSDADGTYVQRSGLTERIREGSYENTDIFPQRIGTVSSVVTIDASKNLYDIVDSSIPVDLNYNDYMIAGEVWTIIFQTGALAGQEFDLAKYYHVADETHAAYTFEIVPKEDAGIAMPSTTIIPAVGDKYIVFHISMPQSYISTAETSLFDKAVEVLYENEIADYAFDGELDPIYTKANWLAIGSKLNAGNFVSFTDPDFSTEPVIIRINGVREYVNKPYEPSIELNNKTSSKSISSKLKELDSDEVRIDNSKRESISYTKRRWRDAVETMTLLEDALKNFASGINPIWVQTMSILVGEESLQFRFVDDKTTPESVNDSFVWSNTTKVFGSSAAIIQHMTIGIKNLSSSHAAAEYLFWDIPAYTSPVMTDLDPFYIYLKCSKTSSAGEVLMSKTPFDLDPNDGFYYFLSATLGSEVEGERSLITTYGFTEITPGRITLDKILSPDGYQYWDMINNKFKIGNATEYLSYNENNDNLLKLVGAIEATSGLIAGWTIGVNTISKGNVILGADGSISNIIDGVTYWTLNPDGSGSVAKGNISWNSEGQASGAFTTLDNLGDFNVQGSIFASGAIVAGALNGTLPDDLPVATSLLYGTIKFDPTTLALNGSNQLTVIGGGGGGSNVSWGTPTAQYTPLTVDAVSRNLSLDGHTHSYLPLSGGNLTGALTINGSTAWHAGNDGTGSGLDADTLDGYHKPAFSQEFNYGTTAGNSGYYKIKILTTSQWMLCFTIRLYQGYKYYDIVIYGYQYGVNYWYLPNAKLLSSSENTLAVNFGYDSVDNLWVAIPAGSYTGLKICNVTNGYNQVEQNWSSLFSVQNVSSLTGTIQTTVTAKRPLVYDENAVSATKLANTITIWGQNFNGEGDVTGALSGATTGTFSSYLTANRFYTGYDAGLANAISCSNWFRSNGATGWLNATYTAGILSDTANIVRTYNTNKFKVYNTAIDSILTLGGVTAANVISSGAVVAGALNGTLPDDLPVATSLLYGTIKFDPTTLALNGSNQLTVIGGSGSDVSWGTATAQYTPLNVESVTRNLSLDGHTHSYLPLSGGPMTGIIYMGTKDLYFNAANSGDIVFSDSALNQTGRVWHDGISLKISGTSSTSANLLSIAGSTFTYNNNTVWHAGNDGVGSGLDADLFEGLHGDEYLRKYPPGVGSGVSLDLNNCSGVNILSGYNVPNSPCTGDVSILTIPLWNGGGKYSTQFIFGMYTSVNPYFRRTDVNGEGTWKQLAFLTDNVASATKLANTRYLWGNAFTGEGDVTGRITFSNYDYHIIMPIGNIGCNVDDSYFWNLSNHPIKFGTNDLERMRIAPTGNVLIGTSTDSGYKLDVNGTFRTTGAAYLNSTLEVTSYATANRFYTGYDAGLANAISCSNWFRSNGATGWLNATYTAGILSDTANIVRTYNTNKFKVYNTAIDSILTLGGVTAANVISSGAVVAGALNGTLPDDLPLATTALFGVAKYSGLAVQPTAGDVALRTKHYTSPTANAWYNKAYTITYEIGLSSPGSLGAGAYYSSLFLYALPTSKCLACNISAIPYATGTTPPWIGHQLIVSATKDATNSCWRVFIYNPTASAVDLTNVKLSIIAQMIE